MKSIILKPGRERSLLNKHPWIFSGALQKKEPSIAIGEEVQVCDSLGVPLALGHWCGDDGLVCRIIAFDPQARLDSRFYQEGFLKALRLRKSFSLPNEKTNGYRLIHGEGDDFSGLVCDIYNDTASIELSNPGLKKCLNELKAFLADELHIKNIVFSDSKTSPSTVLLGQENPEFFLENGLRFFVDARGGQKTGHFLDQRDNRQLIRSWAHGREVLDAFSYSGGFSVYALAGGARKVTSVDISKKALEACQKNINENGFAHSHETIDADCFTYLRTIKRDQFGLIILDPPAFAKTAAAKERAARGYKDINLLALKSVSSGGLVITFSCSQHIDEDLFQKIIFAAAKDAGREVKIIKKLAQGADHPVSVFCPQSFYLKGLALYVA